MKRLQLKRMIGKRVTAVALALVTATLGIGIAPALAAAKKVAVQNVAIYVFRGKEHVAMGSDGLYHDTMVPSNFAVKVGVPVKVTVWNYDEGPHSITAPGLNLNEMIIGGTLFTTPPAHATATELVNSVIPFKSTFTFTPKVAGVYTWHCMNPCDAGASGWAMLSANSANFMSGVIVVVA